MVDQMVDLSAMCVLMTYLTNFWGSLFDILLGLNYWDITSVGLI
jgi:hypothetical protein